MAIEAKTQTGPYSAEQAESGDFSSNPAEIYLKEISRIPLLTAHEEVNLAIGIARGKAAVRWIERNVHQGNRTLTEAESARLNTLVNNGQQARDRLIEANLRLVVSRAKKNAGLGLSFSDLTQEGNIGLIKAVENFDHRMGFRFSTYATWWIRQAMNRAIQDQARTIRISIPYQQIIGRFNRTERNLTGFLQRFPTPQEIADEMRISEARVVDIQQKSAQPVSLEYPVGDGDATLGDFIADERDEIAKVDENSSLRQTLDEEMLSELNRREREVLNWRFGLPDGKYRTLKEVGEILGVTRERIRQVEADALKKLRRPKTAIRLKDYLE